MHSWKDSLIWHFQESEIFRGVSPKSFDGRGNYTIGVKEQLIFPEITFDKVDTIRGMDITIVTTASSDEQGKALLSEMGMPFRKK